MYRIDKTSNNVVKLEQKPFKELRIREREHLQEWIAKNPEMLGEELLIIQKEFDGFNDTSERLDLLALDKDGNLVIIENKLDDTGRNVVWQALKYASYCSTLTTAQIIKIYQDYLDKWGREQDARQSLLEFLEWEEEEPLLNRGDQRIIFVANHYRKEVTSTVLWLRDHDLQIQCFRARPYSMGEELFLQIEQIIPLPETSEFMIEIREKEKEEKEKSRTVEQSEAALVKFWGLLKRELAAHRLDFLERVSSKPHYDLGFWKGPGRFTFCMGRQAFRVELYFSNDPNKTWIDAMAKYKAEIERAFGCPVIWERLEGKKASRIKSEVPAEKFPGRFNDETYWPELIQWYREEMNRFYEAVSPVWDRVQKEVE
ncbi:MAG: DUF4268 domain-containing protein [Saprospiraceae bacterium]|nr:DUF4268 domain-containing protein [Saprospiraceae bacterium]